MNKRIKELIKQAGTDTSGKWLSLYNAEALAELIVDATLTQVAERAYYTGDRDWSDEIDRPWIQLEFGYGPLAEAQKQAGIK